ncbi:Glra2, partial [Symbiodinium pilosum]
DFSIEDLHVDGYKEGVLTEFIKKCNDRDGGTRVDCNQAVKVYIDVNPHELKKIDDQNEEFSMIFVLKLFWLDPDLKHFETTLTVRNPDDSLEAHLRDMKVLITKMFANGDLEYVDLSNGPKQKRIMKKDDYIAIQDPNWERYFFPDFSFLNLQDEAKKLLDSKTLLWSGPKGGFVCCSVKYDATFQEGLELKYFPLDRQLCRITISAEKPVQDFQFVPVHGKKKISQLCDMWGTDDAIQEKCTVYVRHCDRLFPYDVQRSCVKVLFHLERKGDYYFHSVLVMVFLVNIISLCAFSIPLTDASGRLGHVSTSFLAVLAYRYVIDESLPRKEYLTAADVYIIFACSFQVVICIETVILSLLISQLDEEAESIFRTYTYIDRSLGTALLVIWLAVNAYLRYLWKSGQKETWQNVYKSNKEPYAPIETCAACGHQSLSKQCQHSHTDKSCSNCGSKAIETVYYTPHDRSPIVPPQRFPPTPPELKEAKATAGMAATWTAPNRALPPFSA